MVGTDKLFKHFYYIQDMDFQEFKTQLHIYTGTCGSYKSPKIHAYSNHFFFTW